LRKLKLQVQLTVDGFISGSKGEMDWMTLPWTDDVKQYILEITEPVDTILLGRYLAQAFIPYWASAPEDEELRLAEKINNTHKVIFSKTLVTSPWQNTTIANGNLVAEISELKNKAGGDMIVYGGGIFISSLIKEELIDEFHLFVNPAALGSGMTIFAQLNKKLNLKLIRSVSFDCGIVVLNYAANRS
jgi:dihydrofolate reductase